MNGFDENSDGSSKISKGYEIALIIGWVLAIVFGVTTYLHYAYNQELKQEIEALRHQQPAQLAPAE